MNVKKEPMTVGIARFKVEADIHDDGAFEIRARPMGKPGRRKKADKAKELDEGLLGLIKAKVLRCPETPA